VPVVVTGSIATDHLMTFPGKFTEQFVEGQMENVSLSFLVDDLVQHRGGAGANMAFGLGLLGLRPVLVGAVGNDFTEYEAWLSRHGVDTSHVHWSEFKHTSRFVCTTDASNNQIASFYSGAMSEASSIELGPIETKLGPPELVVIGPNDPRAMVRHTDECRDRGYPFAADPSQQLAWADGEMIRSLVDGAEILFTNEYESHLLMQKTGWSADEVLARVSTWVTTRAAEGVLVRQRDQETISVFAVT
jgi:adenosine kinase